MRNGREVAMTIDGMTVETIENESTGKTAETIGETDIDRETDHLIKIGREETGIRKEEKVGIGVILDIVIMERDDSDTLGESKELNDIYALR
jgi:hypothetical protein